MSKLIDLTGQKYNKLTVVKRDGRDKFGHAIWLCRCECGNIKSISGDNIIRELTRSCGCLALKNDFKHGYAGTNIYRKWNGMKNRCFNPNSEKYKDYGARGITVFHEWIKDFLKYYDYVSKLPHYDEDGYSIDRINVDGNYEPGNVRWATAKVQANNQRRNKYNA